jgi:hypothetical protein
MDDGAFGFATTAKMNTSDEEYHRHFKKRKERNNIDSKNYNETPRNRNSIYFVEGAGNDEHIKLNSHRRNRKRASSYQTPSRKTAIHCLRATAVGRHRRHDPCANSLFVYSDCLNFIIDKPFRKLLGGSEHTADDDYHI